MKLTLVNKFATKTSRGIETVISNLTKSIQI